MLYGTERNQYLEQDALRSRKDHIALTWILKDKEDGETLCNEKILSSLTPDIRTIVRYAEQLDAADRKIVVNLVKALKEREDL